MYQQIPTVFRKTTTFSFLFILSFGFLQAQDMEVQSGNPWTPENLISNVFLGDGVEVLSVNFNGANTAVGYFKDGEEDVGISRGIVMTTGQAVGAQGVNQVGALQASNNNGSSATSDELASIAAPNTINDVSEYVIEFIPISDTLRFNYSFASEEYPEYACSNFNDIFGFFISGPGINGPFANNAENIAIIPGTNLPVTINNVNPGVVGANGTIGNCTPPNGSLDYSQFYVDNNGSNSLPIYDGLTTVLTAEAVVMPCSTYTIRLAIADVSDGIFDSGVFLEAKSFGTGTLDVDVATVSLDGTIAEGCSQGVLSFSVSAPVENDLFIDYTIFGTAENGIDYEFIPSDLFIPAGDSTVSVPIIAFDDNLVEGTEFIMVDVQRDVCNRDTFMIPITDNLLVPPQLGPDTTICIGDSVRLDGTLDINLPPPPSFSNTTSLTITPANTEITSDILVFGVQPFTLGPESILSVCIDDLQHNWVDDLQIYLLSPGGQILELVTDIGNSGDDFVGTCFTPSATAPIIGVTDADQPFTGDWAPEGIWSDLWDGDNPVNGNWQLLMRDKFAPDVGILNSWTITFNSVYQVDYFWTPAAGLSCADCPDPIATPDTTTTYIIEAMDSYGCSVYDTITINVLERIEAPALSCANVTGNSVTVTWDDIPGAITYEVNVNGMGWELANSGGASHVLTGLTFSQSVTFEVRGIGDCPGEIATIICQTLDCTPPAFNTTTTEVSCNGGNDGTVQISANGGVPPYTFELDGITNDNGEFIGLAAGTYDAIVSDAADCAGSIQFVVSEPDPLEVTLEIITPVSCHEGADATATVIINGGNGPYSFQWDDGQLDSIATNLDAGLTSIQIVDASGCVSNVEIDIPEPSPISITYTLSDVSCGEAEDGTLAVTPTGGTGDYTYNWSANVNGQTGASLNGLSGDTYTLNIEDENGCTFDTTFVIDENPVLALTTSVENASCYGATDGVGAVQVSGGTGAGTYTYDWTDEFGGTLIGDDVLSGLGGGTYQLLVTDANGCTANAEIIIDAPPALSFSTTEIPPLCVGSADGQSIIEISGGTEPYTYNWSDIGIDDENRDDLSAGTYTLTVTDANDCEVIFDLSLSDPPVISLQSDSTLVSCDGGNDGTATIIPSGGTGDFTYEWEDGQLTQTAVGLLEGTYNVVVTDANGCTAQTLVSVTSNTPIELMISGTDALCNGEGSGTATVVATGGFGDYTYEWSDNQDTQTADGLMAGTYTVTVLDENNCSASIDITLGEPSAITTTTTASTIGCFGIPDGEVSVTVTGGVEPYTYQWSNGVNSSSINGLNQGTYQVTVTDANACTIEDEAEVSGPPAILLSVDGTNIDCNGANNGTINVTASGGEPPYSYSWNTAIPSISNPTDLSPGTYSVTVEDNNGCTEEISFTVTEPQELQLASNYQFVSCAGENDGNIDLIVSGGLSPFTYFWSNGSTDQDQIDLIAGTYGVTVVDANGCQESYEVILNEPDAIRIEFVITDVACFGDSNGSISASIAGGVGPYAIDWEAGSSNNEIIGLSAGVYPVQITDANGCVLDATPEVDQPDQPIAAILTPEDVSCFGDSDGMIVLQASGGTPFYTYSVDNEFFSGSSTLIGLDPGTYNVYIKDANECIYLSDPVTIGEPEPTTVSLGSDFTIEYKDTAFLQATVTGAIGSVFYEWTPIDSSCFDCPAIAVFPDFQTSYKVQVTDENGCTDEDIVTVAVAKDFRVDVPTGFSPNADSVNDRLLVHGQTGTVVKSFRVFDRWGELLFEDNDFAVNDINRGWDGTFRGEDATSGVYIWALTVEYEDGFEEDFKGHTTLIR